MTRIVNHDGAQVYCMRPGDEVPHVQLWPHYGYLAEYCINGTREILWYASRDAAEEQVAKQSKEIGRDDDDAVLWVADDFSRLPERIKEYYHAAEEDEAQRWYYVVRLSKAPGNPGTGFGPFWIDDPNTAMEGDTACGPFMTAGGANTARHQLATNPSIASKWDLYVGWSYEYTTGDRDALVYNLPWSEAHAAGRLLDPVTHRAESYRGEADITTIARFETCRQLLGHGGLIGGKELTHLVNLRIPWEVPSWVPRSDLAGTLATGEPCRGWDVPRFPAEPFRVVNPWAVAAARYVLAIADLSREDEFGFSVPGLIWHEDRPLLLHRTCTGNTVLLATEHMITGWSWTRSELAGVPLTFGPPPDWLAPHLGLSFAPQYQASLAGILRNLPAQATLDEFEVGRINEVLPWEAIQRLPDSIQAMLRPAER